MLRQHNPWLNLTSCLEALASGGAKSEAEPGGWGENRFNCSLLFDGDEASPLGLHYRFKLPSHNNTRTG
jgi:hypothetical protein